MPRVVHFEIHADDPERAMAFYKKVFGWEFRKFDEYEYWLAITGPDDKPGVNGGLIRRKGALKDHGGIMAFVCAMNVADIDRRIAKVTKAGGAVVVEKLAVPGVGWNAYCKDTEGNVFGLHQRDKKAV